MMRKLLLTAFTCLLFSYDTVAQRSYFYTSLKVPAIDYIAYLINHNTSDPNTKKNDGVIFDTGIGVKVYKSFFLETGVEYFVINQFKKKSEAFTTISTQRELVVNNSAFSFQSKPVLIFSSEDGKTKWRLGLGLNLRKLISNANLYSYNKEGIQSPEIKSESSKTGFNFNIQPLAGVDFKMTEKINMGFDLNYVKVNWNRSMDKLSSFGMPGAPFDHKTSNLFLSAHIVY